MLNTSTMARTIRELVFRRANSFATVLAFPSPAARTQSVFHAVPMSGALVFTYFSLALLPSVITKTVTRTVEAVSMVRAVRMANTKVAQFAFPVVVALTSEVRLASTMIAAVIRARSLGTIYTAIAIIAYALACFATPM